MNELFMPPAYPSKGESYGFSNAQRSIKKALEAKGVKFTFSADTELFHCSSHLYNRSRKNSVLWFPYEANKVPVMLVDSANEADLIIASCEENKKAFIASGIIKPIEVCNLGIDTDLFPYEERTNTEPFTFLWVGQNDMRKGWDLISKSFAETFTPQENVQLYLKTSSKNENQELITIGDNVIVDSRNLPQADLFDLYYSSNVFLFPSRGEASGLPAMEAMATGSLVLASPIQGLKDFVKNDTAIPLEYTLESGSYGIDIDVPNVCINGLKETMRKVYNKYSEYSNIRKQGASFIHSNFSLDVLGNNLKNILDRSF